MNTVDPGDLAIASAHSELTPNTLDELTSTHRLARAIFGAHPSFRDRRAGGALRRRAESLAWLGDLPRALVARDSEVLEMIERESRWGRGIGCVDVHLAAAARLGADHVWTADKRFHRSCIALGIAYEP